MDRRHKSRVLARRLSPDTGVAQSDSAPKTLPFTWARGKAKENWTPEDLLLGSLASCFTTTCSSLADHTKLEYTDLEVDAGGTVTQKNSSRAFAEIVVRANLTIPRREDPQRAMRMLQRAWATCLIARSLTVKQSFEPIVTVAGARALAASTEGPRLGKYLGELAAMRAGQPVH